MREFNARRLLPKPHPTFARFVTSLLPTVTSLKAFETANNQEKWVFRKQNRLFLKARNAARLSPGKARSRPLVSFPRRPGFGVHTLCRHRCGTLYNQQRIRPGQRARLVTQTQFIPARRRAIAPEVDRSFEFVNRDVGHVRAESNRFTTSAALSAARAAFDVSVFDLARTRAAASILLAGLAPVRAQPIVLERLSCESF